MENVATEEFISRTEALKDFESCNAENPNWTPQRVKTLLLRQPAADVAEVVHGSGKVRETEEAETTQIIDGCCTACGAFMDCCEAADYKYCPMCGLKFRRDK